MNIVRFVAALLVAIAYTAGTPLVPEITDGTQRHESTRQEASLESPAGARQTDLDGHDEHSAKTPPRQSVEAPEPTCQPTPPPTTTPAPQPFAGRASPAGERPACGPDGTAGIVPITAPRCTMNATRASQVSSARPGDTICVKGDVLAGTQLRITTSGTARAPITITGEGDTPVKGIRVNASNVVVQGFTVIDAAAPGVQLKGNNLTLRSTKIDHPTGGDFDGIRFFGDNIKIQHNHIVNITNTGGAHADCMQTFATTTPTSHNVLISGNRCEKIDNQCLIAQGPHSRAGDGSGRGESSGLTFTNNYCEANASQAVHIDDFQNVTMMSNDIQGRVRKAFNLINSSTGARVSCNKLGPGVGTEILVNKSSRSGYQGPR